MSDRRRVGRILSAAVSVLVLVAASCGGSGNESSESGTEASTGAALPECPLDALEQATGPVDVVLWNYWSGKNKDVIDTLVARYNASHPKVRVHLESQGAAPEELQAKFQSALPSRELPAILVGTAEMAKSLIDSGVILPAQSCVDADHYDTSGFVPVALAAYSVGGVLYAGSVDMASALLYYNKEQFRQAGLDPEAPPGSLADLRADAEALAAAGVEKPYVMLTAGFLVDTWLTGAGVPLVDNDNGRGPGQTTAAAFDTDQTRQLFTWFRDMYRDGLLDAIAYTPGNPSALMAVGAQQSTMDIDNSQSAGSVFRYLEGAQGAVGMFGIGAFPGLTGPGQASLYSEGLFITNTSPPEVQAAAWDFLKWWNEPDQQLTLLRDATMLPLRTSVVDDPAIQDWFTTDPAGMALAIAFQQVMAIGPDNPGPLIGPFDQTRELLGQAVERMLFEGVEPDVAVADAASQTTAALQQYNEGSF